MWLTLFKVALLLGPLPLLLFKIRQKKMAQETLPMEPYLWLVALSSFYEFFGTTLLNLNSEIWFRTFILLEFLCLLYYFFHLLGKKPKLLFLAFFVVFSIGFVWLLFLWNTIDNFAGDSYLSIIVTLFIYTFSFLWFKDLFTNLKLKSLWDCSAFYFISGLLLYFSGTLFLFLMSATLFKYDMASFQKYWNLNIAFSFLIRLLLLLGVWKGQQK